jgi:flagellum-specific peptidoglycan hydrolase FlgJ
MSIVEIINIYLKGYATEPEYFNSKRRLIEKFDLNSYDN